MDEQTRRRYVALARQARKSFKALLPDPEALAAAHKVAVVRTIASKIESSTEAPDIAGVMDSVSELLDRSVAANEYMIGTARADPLIDEYNAGTHNLEELLRRLKAINDELTDEEQRAVREGVTEEELAVFDLLTKPEPDLTRAQAVQVKSTAKKLLDHVTDKLVLDWKRKQQTRSAVKVAIKTVLDNELPDAYRPELFDRKVDAVYEHIYTSYHNNGESVYD